MYHAPALRNTAEGQRLSALRSLNLLDTRPDAAFDALTALAASVTGCPHAFIALIDSDRLWAKSRFGDVPEQLARTETVCDITIFEDRAIVVDDLSRDTRFAHLPCVASGIRFYAGLPLRAADDRGLPHPVGTICVFDQAPRGLSDTQLAALAQLAILAESLFASQQAAVAAGDIARKELAKATVLQRQQRLFRQAERMGRMGWWRLTLDDNLVEWSDGVLRIHDLERGRLASLGDVLGTYPPASRAIVRQAIANTIDTGQPLEFEIESVSRTGVTRRIRAAGEVEWSGDRPVAIVGVVRDVSEEYALAEALRRTADTDELTRIPNRLAFNRQLQAAIATARDGGRSFGLVLIDLDGFKRVNDTYGHPAGDEVLMTIGKRLRAPWLAECCAMRLGGDEFAIIVDVPALLDDGPALIARLEDELRVSTRAGGLTMETGASVALTRFDPARFASTREFVHESDRMLYAVKRCRIGQSHRPGLSHAAA
jgi:diguanylate cyclase (GGDEF)-like protein